MRCFRKRRLHCEPLEDRRVLATFTVNDLGDTSDANPGDGIAADAAGMTTLRAAIEESNANLEGDEIVFSVSGVIGLTSGSQLEITDEVSIDGGGDITIDGLGATRVLRINNDDGAVNSFSASLGNLTITGGFSPFGSGIQSYETTDLSNVVVTGNIAEQPNANYDAFGAGILNAGEMTIVGSTISDNQARDPAGSVQGNANGGGIFNYQVDANLTITATTISGNMSSGAGGGLGGQQNFVQILNSTVSGNQSGAPDTFGGYGGGINMTGVAYGVPNGPISLSIIDSDITGNRVLTDSLTANRFPYGGGIYAGGYGSVTIEGGQISDNYVGGLATYYTPLARGAGAFFSGFGGTYNILAANISGVTMDGNTALAQGGAIGIRGRDASNVFVDVSESDITNNDAMTFQGGAFFTWSPGSSTPSATLHVVDSVVSGNSANNGGASMTWFGGEAHFARSTIEGNNARSYGGGAIFNLGFQLTYGQLAPRVSVVDSTLSSNSAPNSDGGAIWSYDGALEVTQSTISGNSAVGIGGGLYLATYYSYVGTSMEYFPYIERSTIANNEAGTGGGLSGNYYVSPTIANSVISGNSALLGPEFYDVSSPSFTANFNYNLVGDNSGTGLTAANPDANGNIIGDFAAPIDALLGPLGSNGGSTKTHVPMYGSPLIDAADPFATGDNDQRGPGFVRISDGRMDMGSVETQVFQALGDFNFDGFWNCQDVNALSNALGDLTGNLAFDMNMDGVLDLADLDEWLVVGGLMNSDVTGGNAFLPGDANLDAIVDGIDFIIWNNSKFSSNKDWCGGNFNGDSVTDALDFIAWNSSSFQSSDSSAVDVIHPFEEARLSAGRGGTATGAAQVANAGANFGRARMHEISEPIGRQATDVVFALANEDGESQEEHEAVSNGTVVFQTNEVLESPRWSHTIEEMFRARRADATQVFGSFDW